ncbi:hypothetical protein WR25_22878 [Diploscapter pachys]|uniref:Uncharacterized protein n=1 Tax=Diploscapter pachys TaxID=2018661 RepID=A0A2A2KAB4_9BILA|nr:hypothetical protein WR25_22878 [Diploscapter pachys]
MGRCRSWRHLAARPPAHRAVVGVVDGQAEPAIAIWLAGLPVAAMRLIGCEVPISDLLRCVGLQVEHDELQAMLRDPGLALIAVALVEVGQVGMLEHSVLVAHDRRSLDQLDFFRHDDSLAAISRQ